MKKILFLLFWLSFFQGENLSAQNIFMKKEAVDSSFMHNYAGNRAGLIQLLTDIQAANFKTRLKISKQLRPKEEDYKLKF